MQSNSTISDVPDFISIQNSTDTSGFDARFVSVLPTLEEHVGTYYVEV